MHVAARRQSSHQVPTIVCRTVEMIDDENTALPGQHAADERVGDFRPEGDRAPIALVT